MSEFLYWSARQLRDAISAGELSALEVTQAALARIERFNPPVNAVVQLCAERALEEARQADACRSSGQLLGPLHGVPMTLKDSIDTEADAATDDLDTITFPSSVTLAVICPESPARAVTLKHGTGNIKTASGNDWILPANGFALIYFDGSFAQVIATALESGGFLQLPTNNNAGRGAAGTPGRVFFNTDDGQLNIDDGTNWTLPDGTTT